MTDYIICCKCGESILADNWEVSMQTCTIDARVSSQAQLELFGDRYSELYKNHPAVLDTDAQRLIIKFGSDTNSPLCWNCYRNFISHIGEFLKDFKIK